MNPLQHQLSLDESLRQLVDGVFDQGQLDPLVQWVNRQLPPLVDPMDVQPVTEKIVNPKALHSPESIELESGPVKLTVNRELGIRLYHHSHQITTDIGNIPTHYPWFSHDPTDPDHIAEYATKHVARGSRADTWPEDQWPLVGGIRQGEQNWPPRSVAFGPYHLELASDGPVRAILVSLPPDESGQVQPNAYGIVPRGIFSLTPEGSVLMAWQNHNHSTQGLHWAAWFILGFAMPIALPSYRHPSVIFAFPDNISPDPVTQQMTQVWNYYEIAGQKMALINPHIKTLNEPFKKFYRDTNWCVVAAKGMGYVIVTQSLLQHEEQFFPFLEHGQYFIEAEFTGRRVAPGEKSTVLVKQSIIPVTDLTQGAVSTLREQNGQFEQDVLAVLEVLVNTIGPKVPG